MQIGRRGFWRIDAREDGHRDQRNDGLRHELKANK